MSLGRLLSRAYLCFDSEKVTRNLNVCYTARKKRRDVFNQCLVVFVSCLKTKELEGRLGFQTRPKYLPV